MALGAIIAMNNAGMDPKSVPIVGIDATDDGIEALKAGEMDMTVYQSHEGQASGSVLADINMLEGKDICRGTDCKCLPSALMCCIILLSLLQQSLDQIGIIRQQWLSPAPRRIRRLCRNITF